MAIYKDWECRLCGDIRAARSDLCEGCLVSRYSTDKKNLEESRSMISVLKKEVDWLKENLEEAIAYGFKQNRINTKAIGYIAELEKQRKDWWGNAEDGLVEITKV